MQESIKNDQKQPKTAKNSGTIGERLLRAADYCTVYSYRNLSRTDKKDGRSGERLLRTADYCTVYSCRNLSATAKTGAEGAEEKFEHLAPKAPEKILNILRRRRQRKIDFDFSTLENL